jgi:OmcA/MtrC family decaheme c-type cytochrome
LIHRIHTGEELTQMFTVYGFYLPPNPPNPVNYNEVRFPGDRRNCLKCHNSATGINGGPTYSLPVPTSVDSVVTQRDYFSPQGPGTASCLGCHDTRDAAAHAWLNTAPFGEACGTCHASAGDWAVEKVHAR